MLVDIVNRDFIAKLLEKCPSYFICKVCYKQYKMLTKCENHIQSHLGVKPYECHSCKRRYLKKSILNEHYCIDRGGKLHKCKLCDSSYRHKKNFKKRAESSMQVICVKYSTKRFHYSFTIGHILVQRMLLRNQLF